ncbi:MAG: T9SS type A sorting domain-containing protein [Bacteroidetes bacterium]|nr:T9SS type A sorting domain-containing protein [Bacteroidota bacterium]
MKKIHTLAVLCLLCLLFQAKSAMGQDRPTPTPSPTPTTVWNGQTWSHGVPNPQTKAIFAADFKAQKNILADAIEILSDVRVTFTDHALLMVTNDIQVAKTGKLIFEENAQFIQKNPNASVASMIFKRKTRKIDKFDYTYFCSPVEGQVLNQITDYNVAGGVDAFYQNSDPLLGYQPPLFDKYAYFNQSATPASYYTNFFNSGNWTSVPETSTMDPGGQAGMGFIVRGPQSFAQGNKQVWWTKFEGVPHNGTYTVPVTGVAYTPCGSNQKYSPAFIGNPYPSMLDADAFLSNSANVANLSGAIYLWTHNTGPAAIPGEATYNYTANDFVIYNLVGGVGTGRVNGEPIYAPNNYNRPNGKIAMCQGFITRGINSTGVATFTNSMRDYSLDAPSDVDNQQFFRTSGNNSVSSVTKNRYWVSIEAAAGAGAPYKETLVGYMPATSAISGSTNGYEKAYDTEIYYPEATSFKIYTIINSTTTCPRLVIQGRRLDATFNSNDVVNLGFTCPAGSYRIKLEGTEGLFTTQPIWLREEVSPGVFQYYDDIRTTGHLFTSTGDTDNTTRFAIIYSLPITAAIINNHEVTCGTSLPNAETNVFSSIVPGASAYHFEVSTPSGTVVAETTGNVPPTFQPHRFWLNFAPIQPNTTYWVRVATYQVNGQWVYGPICQLTTPPLPAVLRSPTCGSTIANKWVVLTAQQITNLYGVTTQTLYRFNTVVNGVPYQSAASTSNTFQFNSFTGIPIIPGYTYPITVEVFWNNQWYSGPVCNLVASSTFSRISNNDFSIFEVESFPNPFSNNFKLNLNTSSSNQISVKVFDMLGRLIENSVVPYEEIGSYEYGNNLNSGIYNIVVTQDDNLKTLRVIKR